MSWVGRMALVVLVTVPLASCGRTMEVETEPQMPEAEHVSTRSVLREASEYRAWPRFDAYRSGPIKSWGHDAVWFVAHYNEAAVDAVDGRRARFPEGSIIVGENRVTPDGEPVALTTMTKRSGQWRFIGHEVGGRVLMTGDVDACRSCHQHAALDMVFGASGAER